MSRLLNESDRPGQQVGPSFKRVTIPDGPRVGVAHVTGPRHPRHRNVERNEYSQPRSTRLKNPAKDQPQFPLSS
jgi:hypothetical protein